MITDEAFEKFKNCLSGLIAPVSHFFVIIKHVIVFQLLHCGTKLHVLQTNTITERSYIPGRSNKEKIQTNIVYSTCYYGIVDTLGCPRLTILLFFSHYNR